MGSEAELIKIFLFKSSHTNSEKFQFEVLKVVSSVYLFFHLLAVSLRISISFHSTYRTYTHSISQSGLPVS